MDVSNPEQPELTGSFTDQDPTVSGLRLSLCGDLACIAAHRDGLRIVDASDQENPFRRAIYQEHDSHNVTDVIIRDSVAFFTDVNGVEIVDISSQRLDHLGTADVQEWAYSVALESDLLLFYVRDHRGIYVYDVSDLNDPEELGFYETGEERATDIAMKDSILYYTTEKNGLFAVDVSDPADPMEIGHYDTRGKAFSVEIRDGLIYVADKTNVGVYRLRLNQPIIETFPERLDFGDVPTDDTGEITLSVHNVGMTNLNISEVSIESEYFAVEFDEMIVIEPQSSAELDVTFSPERFIDYHSEIQISSNDEEDGELFIDLVGVGITPENVLDNNEQSPIGYSLLPPYPNPFNSTTVISYNIPIATNITLELYNLLGQRVLTLFEGQKQAGVHSVTMSASDLPSGLYFVKLEASENLFTKKVMLIK